jgi:lipoate-protein ligase A
VIAVAMPGRLILDEPMSGIANMSIDAAILQSLQPDSGPTLRFYRWSQPTLSLGYFQRLEDRSLHPTSERLAIVRRSTGGGAIVHHHELTYSLTVPVASRSTGASRLLYQSIHDSFIEALQSLGIVATRFGASRTWRLGNEPFLCFQRRTSEDLVVSGYKVLGSAQRRGTSGILQHGSLLLSASEFAPQLPGLIELSDHRIVAEVSGGVRCAVDALVKKVIASASDAIAQAMGIQWAEGLLSKDETEQASYFGGERFGSEPWTGKR